MAEVNMKSAYGTKFKAGGSKAADTIVTNTAIESTVTELRNLSGFGALKSSIILVAQ
ncbi:hypothetical protein CDL15_Pgr024175 [Punica granatum]|uniref:Uncharacterized protein n=1 Tax=Punica granatum TaxID=22663 RepID=A0A218XWI9_PUNGR|nr:hypothetical protein CDL15_Pgr024175 [Punica granatum]